MLGAHPFIEILGAADPENLDSAKVAAALAKVGVAVLPLTPGTKTPLKGSSGVHDASTDLATVRKMFKHAVGEPAPGIACDPVKSRFLTLDPDTSEAMAVTRELLGKALGIPAEAAAALPPTVTTARSQNPKSTRFGGGHFVIPIPDGIELPEGLSISSLEKLTGVAGLDLLGAGTKYQVLPPTQVDGFYYRVTGDVIPYTDGIHQLLIDAAAASPKRKVRDGSAIVSPGTCALNNRIEESLTWEMVFDGTGYVERGDDHGCVVLTRPGTDAAKSLTIHVPGCAHGAGGCTVFSTTTMTQFPALESIAAERGRNADAPTFTKLEMYAAIHHSGDMAGALSALGISGGREAALTDALADVDPMEDFADLDDSLDELLADAVGLVDDGEIESVTEDVPETATEDAPEPTIKVNGADPLADRLKGFVPPDARSYPLYVAGLDGIPDDGTATSPWLEHAVCQSSELLRHAYATSKIALVGPFTGVAGMMQAAALAIPPSVVIPPVVTHSSAGLNIYHAAVGVPGLGKSGSRTGVFDFRVKAAPGDIASPSVIGMGYREITPASGEAIAASFVEMLFDAETKEKHLEQVNEATLLIWDEIDGANAKMASEDSTLSAELRKAWTGTQILGTFTKGEQGRLLVAGGKYRLVAVFGVQPSRAAALLREGGGGLPARIFWYSANDPRPDDDNDDLLPPTVMPVELDIPPGPIFIHPDVRKEIRSIRRQRLKHGNAPEDRDDLAHACLLRLKEASIAALAHGLPGVTPEAWDYSGYWLLHSQRTRDDVGQGISVDLQKNLVAKAKSEADLETAKSAIAAKKYIKYMPKLREWCADNPDAPVTLTTLARHIVPGLAKTNEVRSFLTYSTDNGVLEQTATREFRLVKEEAK